MLRWQERHTCKKCSSSASSAPAWWSMSPGKTQAEDLSQTELNQLAPAQGEITRVLTGCEDGERQRTTQTLSDPMSSAWQSLHSVWTSRSCLSQRCRNHPWGREHPWLLSTASLPIKANTHRIIHTGCTDKDESIGPNSFTSFTTFLYYIGFPGWVSNGPLQTKIVSRRNKRKQTLHAKAHFIFFYFPLHTLNYCQAKSFLSLSYMFILAGA